MDLNEATKYYCGLTHVQFTYNNSMTVMEVPLLQNERLRRHFGQVRYYYSGACRSCCSLTSKSQPLQRCARCHLVAYCGKNCQRNDWEKHKIFCKTFQVKNGKNALIFEDETRKDQIKWDDAMQELINKAYAKCMDQSKIDKFTFHNFFQTVFSPFSRVCNICKYAQQDKLFDCSCCCVAYCCKAHEQEDTSHKDFCKEMSMFPLIDYLKLREPDESLKLPCVLKNTVKTQFEPIDDTHFEKIKIKMLLELGKNQNGDLDLIPPSPFSKFDLLFAVLTSYLAFPLTILCNLQMFGVGKDRKPIQTVSTLNVHIMTLFPVFDSTVWEYFMHLLPALMELNISYITPRLDKGHMDYNGVKLKRCKDCKTKGRIINYTVQRHHYHMFFSSDKYTDPDVVAVFGNVDPSRTFAEVEKEHPIISYRNMTHSNDTLLILTDATMISLMVGVQYVRDACPTLEMLLRPTTNPMSGFGMRHVMLTNMEQIPVVNHKKFVCCLRNS